MPLTPLPGFSLIFAPPSNPVIPAVEAVGVKQMLAKDMRGGMPAARSLVSCTRRARLLLHSTCCAIVPCVCFFVIYLVRTVTAAPVECTDTGLGEECDGAKSA